MQAQVKTKNSKNLKVKALVDSNAPTQELMKVGQGQENSNQED